MLIYVHIIISIYMKKWIAITSVVEEGVLKKRVLLRKVWCVRGACVVCSIYDLLAYCVVRPCLTSCPVAAAKWCTMRRTAAAFSILQLMVTFTSWFGTLFFIMYVRVRDYECCMLTQWML